jgi:hypothetical protein
MFIARAKNNLLTPLRSSIYYTTHTTPKFNYATMSGKEGKSITSWADKDGSFKRQVSSFRDVIEPGGKYEPEKGGSFIVKHRYVLTHT